MHGIFAASTGFSVEFFPESAILGCGPDAARAYPYTVVATAGGAQIKIDAPDHPLIFAFNPDGSLVRRTRDRIRYTAASLPGRIRTMTSPSRPWSRPAIWLR